MEATFTMIEDDLTINVKGEDITINFTEILNQRVIEELENIAKEIYKAKEIGVPIANRIKELNK
jgi:hypothetical protein